MNMTKIKLLAVAAIAVIGCGDNKAGPDGRTDSFVPSDAYCSSCPAAPTVGAQIDRMGRAAVNTALNASFDPTAAAQTAKQAYNENSDIMTWFAPAMVMEFAKNLALIDVLDKSTAGGVGCTNQALYNGTGGGTPNAMSYFTLAAVLLNDQIFIDTSKTTCVAYLAVEFGLVAGSFSSCGGRAPEYDVVDFSYSMLAAGVGGFDSVNGVFVPKIGDGVAVHDDVTQSFPYLGAPN
jgi:hypothetical protein